MTQATKDEKPRHGRSFMIHRFIYATVISLAAAAWTSAGMAQSPDIVAKMKKLLEK